MQIINEGSAVEISIALRGDDNSLQTPTTLKYRVDCETTGTAITGWTSVTPESKTVILIPATSNAIQDDSQPYEDKVCTTMSDEGLDTQLTKAHKYRVQNLGGIG